MTKLLRFEDGLIQGYLSRRFYNPPVRLNDSSAGGYNQKYNNPWAYKTEVPPSNGSGGGYQGENGKPSAADNSFGYSGGATLSGYGASQVDPGAGFETGDFGIGGGSYGYLESCGGGSGWYGGGSSYTGAGGGGGSGYVLTHDSPKPDGYFPPVDLNGVKTYVHEAVSGSEEYVNDVNTGDGLCIINETFEFSYTGEVQKFVVPATGFYTIECFGAQGGGVNGVSDSRFTGGRGGYVKADFFLYAGMELFIYVGQEGGRLQTNAWNGGGVGQGSSFGGGGATDVRWSGESGSTQWRTNLYDRFIVAGGGGGSGRVSGGDNDLDNLTRLTSPDMSPNGGETETDIIIEPRAYLVNDKSRVTIKLIYQASLSIVPDTKFITCKLFLDGDVVGSSTTSMLGGVRDTQFIFDLDSYLDPDTPSFWAVLRAELTLTPLDTVIIIPPRGLEISVSTVLRPSETVPTDKPRVYLTRNMFKFDIFEFIDIYHIDLKDRSGGGDGETIDDPDKAFDIIAIEDHHTQEVKDVMRSDSNLEGFSFEDSADLSRVSVLRYDSNVNTVQLLDVFLIEGLDEKQPDLSKLDTLKDQYDLKDFLVYDFRGVHRETLNETGNFNDVATFNKSTVMRNTETDSFETVDVYFLEGIGRDRVSIDPITDNLDFSDINIVTHSNVTDNNGLSTAELGDVYMFYKVTVKRVSKTEQVTLSDVFKLDFN